MWYVPPISFQNFLQAFKIVVDSWKFSMLLLFIYLLFIWNKTDLTLTLCIAQSAGSVEYTDCSSAEG